jgi:hypothetical protein
MIEQSACQLKIPKAERRVLSSSLSRPVKVSNGGCDIKTGIQAANCYFPRNQAYHWRFIPLNQDLNGIWEELE